MWTFKKKQTESDNDQEALNEIKSFRDIGEKFKYLGITMIVVSHYDLSIYGPFACLVCEYKNNHGEIKNRNFSLRELAVLRAENPTEKTD